jgi:hypothetical protein
VSSCIYCEDLTLHSSINFLCECPQLATNTTVITPYPKQAPQITGLGLALWRQTAVCRTLCVWISTRTHLGFGCKQGSAKFWFGVRYDWNDWKTQKRHASTNIEKLLTTRLMLATVRYVVSGVGLRKFQTAWFLFHKVYNTLSTCDNLGSVGVFHLRRSFTLSLNAINDCDWSVCFFISWIVDDPVVPPVRMSLMRVGLYRREGSTGRCQGALTGSTYMFGMLPPTDLINSRTEISNCWTSKNQIPTVNRS